MNESLDHTKWECKYYVAFIPKYGRQALYGSLRRHLGSLFRELARHKECEIRGAPEGRSCGYADLDSAESLTIGTCAALLCT